VQTRSKHVDVFIKLVPNLCISCVLKVVTCTGVYIYIYIYTLKMVSENDCYSTTVDISLVSFKRKSLKTRKLSEIGSVRLQVEYKREEPTVGPVAHS
jgi:hypothetical protein